MPERLACTCGPQQPPCPACRGYEAPAPRPMRQLLLGPEPLDIGNLTALLAEARGTRKRLRQAWLRNDQTVKRLQRQLRQATKDKRRKPKQVPRGPREEP